MSADPMPPWVQRALVVAGHLDENGNGRRARARHCRTCGLVVLTGYDDDVTARLVTCDPRPLTTVGEALALVAGLYTRTLHHRAGRLELDKRDDTQIRHHPAGDPSNRYDVLVQHVCHGPRFPTGPSWRTDPVPQPLGSAPPF